MKPSYWQTSTGAPKFGKLDRDLKVDVVVVGGGTTGITAAYLLKRAGKSVALLERDRCLEGDSGRTTAHLTCVTDLRLHELVKNFGREEAKATWDAGQTAIDVIEEIVRREQIDCEFRRVPGYLHAPLKVSEEDGGNDDRDRLMEDAQLARELGFDVRFTENVPVVNRPGMRVANQGKFHPLKYLQALLGKIEGGGSFVFEESEATEFNDDPMAVKANGFAVRCDYIVIATHVPLMGNTPLISATLFQTKLAPYSSYVLGATLPKGTLPEACFWDTSDPYYYLRVDAKADADYVIFGGEDHKTGQVTNTDERYARLEGVLKRVLPKAVVDRRWSGQVIATNDGLPLIGEIREGQFISTGYVGNGITFGTIGGLMACDLVRGWENPWRELFDPRRKKARGGLWQYVRENFDYPYYLVKDRLRGADGESVESVRPGEGKILKIDGQRVAAHRDESGKVTLLSATCTHMGSIVHWNAAEKTWDCPCHGSRFKLTGEVLGGPAETPLDKQSAED